MHQFLLYDKAFIMPSSILNPLNTSWLECSCCHHLLFEKHNQSNIIHIRRHIIHTCPHCDTSFRYIIADEKLFHTLQSCGDIVEMTNKTTNILSDEEIDTFNAYLEDNDLPTAFCNTDFVNIYKKIVGNTPRYGLPYGAYFFYRKAARFQRYKLRHGVLSNCTNVSATHHQNTGPLGAV